MPTFTLPDSIPERAANQDEVVVALVLRRVDPENADGSAAGDLPKPFDPENVALAQGLVATVNGSVFDPATSYVVTVSSTDVEASGSVTVADLDAIFNAPPSEG